MYQDKNFISFGFIHIIRITLQDASHPWRNCSSKIIKSSPDLVLVACNLAWNWKPLLHHPHFRGFFWYRKLKFRTSFKMSREWCYFNKNLSFKIFSVGTPFAFALELDAKLVDYLENVIASIPANDNTCCIQHDKVLVETTLWDCLKSSETWYSSLRKSLVLLI